MTAQITQSTPARDPDEVTSHKLKMPVARITSFMTPTTEFGDEGNVEVTTELITWQLERVSIISAKIKGSLNSSDVNFETLRKNVLFWMIISLYLNVYD